MQPLAQSAAKMKVLLAFAALLVAHAAAHLCLITPHQRGDMQGLDMAGECVLHSVSVHGVSVYYIRPILHVTI